MQTNLLWTGREYYSLENCLVSSTDEGVEINSIIVGSYESKLYCVEYYIRTNKNWETVFFKVKSQHNDTILHHKYEGDGKGNWLANGKPVKEFEGCIDIDIPLTPFTNTLPINRLKLTTGDQHLIKVIYIDLLEATIHAVRQKYTRLSENEYQYENVPNDFEAKIKVDDLGFIIDYPSLFVRTARLESNYPLNNPFQ